MPSTESPNWIIESSEVGGKNNRYHVSVIIGLVLVAIASVMMSSKPVTRPKIGDPSMCASRNSTEVTIATKAFRAAAELCCEMLKAKVGETTNLTPGQKTCLAATQPSDSLSAMTRCYAYWTQASTACLEVFGPEEKASPIALEDRDYSE